MPDAYLVATYEDGYTLTEDEADHSPWDSGRNVFHAIQHSRPVEVHGPLVRLSLVCPTNTFTIEWTDLHETARPISYRKYERDFLMNATGDRGEPIGDKRLIYACFGYQTTEAGKNHKQGITVHWTPEGEEVVEDHLTEDEDNG